MKRIIVLMVVAAVLFVVPMQVFGMEVGTSVSSKTNVSSNDKISNSEIDFGIVGKVASAGMGLVGCASLVVAITSYIIGGLAYEGSEEAYKETLYYKVNVGAVATMYTSFTMSLISAFLSSAYYY